MRTKKPIASNLLPMIPQEVLEGWLAQWLESEALSVPCRRAPKCWGCGRSIKTDEVWHVFFRKQQREAHVCDYCVEPYMQGPIASLERGRVVWHVNPTLEQMEKMVAKLKELKDCL